MAHNPANRSATQERPSQGSPEVSIVVPCYNEVENVRPLVEAVERALPRHHWELIFVDDNSPDGTMEEVRRLAAEDGRVRGLRRVGRRGLSSAVIEGALSSSARVVVVMDGDLQHDESCLEEMVEALLKDEADLSVASRYVSGGSRDGLANSWRQSLSQGGTWLARLLLGVPLTDPMSGFFALPRHRFEAVAPALSGRGFKILLDLTMMMPTSEKLRVHDVPMVFRERQHGESKLGLKVMLSFATMLLQGACRRHPVLMAGSAAATLAGSAWLGRALGRRKSGRHGGAKVRARRPRLLRKGR
ncbi:polyprenol monophosphomannose synthase [Oecophyllibacter saccharovorans]|uniref:polyprenol monophosphomannose synthase n=1 Tax=Oecophyllibacter saccharovorans TaxID=2558360 RepID=UPI00117039C6|nr:polyprenol monophosphomannose synthase [Oecophyllibacter saccharovorans]TPW35248.1 polyprenol monophosphomannose synthase [Oecophyllibacter saccharovorans]